MLESLVDSKQQAPDDALVSALITARDGDERLTKVPADLDLKPYRDEHDYDLVQRMLDCIARGEGPRGIKTEHLQTAVARHMPHLKIEKLKPKTASRKR